ncbi:nudix hydrolase 15, mitochondrial [Flavobacteriaceae bacterium UJ101]|nr:nudix hydrolase 15, mitochondrial [Flavobacteriaceae bacterium UJ101]
MIKNKLEELINHIQYTKLRGEEAHKEMSPTNRSISAKGVNINEIRKASVLIVLYGEAETINFPLIERHVYEGNHSGEIGLPGGKIEDFDQNTSSAALRETEEELGILRDDIEIIKELTSIYIPPSNFLVTPYIGFLSKKPDYVPDPIEVKNIIDISVNQLVNEDNKIKVSIDKKHIQATVPAFQFENHIVWGATACILNELKYLLKNH